MIIIIDNGKVYIIIWFYIESPLPWQYTTVIYNANKFSTLNGWISHRNKKNEFHFSGGWCWSTCESCNRNGKKVKHSTVTIFHFISTFVHTHTHIRILNRWTSYILNETVKQILCINEISARNRSTCFSFYIKPTPTRKPDSLLFLPSRYTRTQTFMHVTSQHTQNIIVFAKLIKCLLKSLK